MGLYYPGGGGLLNYGGRAYAVSTDAENVDLFTQGTYTCATTSTYKTSAFALANAAVNQRRFEYDPNLPGGTGLLMEGSRTNACIRSEELDNAFWGKADCTVTPSDHAAPDGANDADRVSYTVGLANGRVESGVIVVPDNSPAVATVYLLNRSGFNVTQIRPIEITDKAGVVQAGTATTLSSTDWIRYEKQVNSVGVGAGALLGVGRNINGLAGGSLWAWGAQYENAFFASSYIPTAATAVTRGGTVLTLASNQYPTSYLSRGFRILFAPIASSTSVLAQIVATGIAQVLISRSGAGYLALVNDGGVLKMALQGSSGIIRSAALTFSAGDVLTVTPEMTAGRLTVAGASGGSGTVTGTVGAWATGTLTLGNLASNSFAYGRFGRFLYGR